MTTENPALPPTLEIAAEVQCYRVIKREFGTDNQRLYDGLDPNPFNDLEWLSDTIAFYQDGEAVSGRFAPFRSKDGIPVPVLYLAPLKETAYFEAMLRPVGHDGLRTLEKDYVQNLEAVCLTFDAPLKLADCRAAYLKGGDEAFWDYTEDELFNQTQLKCIKSARALAKHIYDNYPEIDGIVWDSVQHSGCVPCYMLFGKRRAGKIGHTFGAIVDRASWKPYFYQAAKSGQVSMAHDLAALM
ncbi:RES domain-containing protein [Vibrio owensii]|uniref:RES domain-containing protein n=1 Tax=Vibrio owensii TaxID=696485 RepID=UPI0022DDAB50|nr:RES domain-containing protein [Vibrio owensii]MDA0383558.1 RES domain-containing protein [Vibrio owensii]